MTVPSADARHLVWELVGYANPFIFVRTLWRHRHLIRQLTWREVTGRYRSSFLGIAWSFLTPLVTLALFTFLFGVVFQARWPGARTGNLAEFGLVLFAGLTAFSLFSECVSRAPTLITSSPNYVKKVVFPLEILSVSVLGSALFHAAISLFILLMAYQIISDGPVWTAIFLPVVFVPLAFLALGTSWLLASLGVFFRDIGHTVALALQALLFLTPIFYPPDALPENVRSLVEFNPLGPMVENVRRVAVQGRAPDWSSFGFSVVIGVLVLCVGHAWFARTKRAFADVV